MAPSHTPSRRRQRSVRVSVAVALLSVATVAVLFALPTQSPVLLSVSAVAALVLGWAALRIVWTEVLQTRRENATDRAAAAQAYHELFSERAAEHAEFTTAMTDRLAKSQLTMRELQGALAAAQRQAAELQIRAESAESALEDSVGRIAELQAAIHARQADQANALAEWESDGGDALRDLVEWAEQQDAQAALSESAVPRHAAKPA